MTNLAQEVIDAVNREMSLELGISILIICCVILVLFKFFIFTEPD